SSSDWADKIFSNLIQPTGNGYNVYYNDFYESIYHGNTGQKKAQTVIKKITILPCIPSVTYTYRF
uniref:hypothetical protein n=1 Tax=uncultured Bacteroides sp. TaxID=162156 RepID=UPI00259619BD